MQEATFSEIEVIKDEGTQRDAVSMTGVAQTDQRRSTQYVAVISGKKQGATREVVWN